MVKIVFYGIREKLTIYEDFAFKEGASRDIVIAQVILQKARVIGVGVT